jgi:phage-related minor tail protein
MGGGAYLVGERGPEIFVPTQSGQIVPNSELTAAGGSVNISAHLEGLPMRATTPFEVAQQLRRVSSMGLIGPRTRTVPASG